MGVFILPIVTTAEREAITPALGEMLYDETNGEIYKGNGSTAGGVQVTGSGGGITEAQVINTTRQFTKGQGTAPVALSIVGGNVTPDLAAGNAFTLNVSANFTLQLPTNDRTTSWHIRCTVTGAGGYTTTTVAGYVADGGGTVTLPTVTGDKYTLFCQSYGDGTHSIAIHTDQA